MEMALQKKSRGRPRTLSRGALIDPVADGRILFLEEHLQPDIRAAELGEGFVGVPLCHDAPR